MGERTYGQSAHVKNGGSTDMPRNARALLTLFVCALGAAFAAGPAVAAPGDLQGVDLSLQAKHDLASPGHDGQIKPRGQNGDLDVLGNTVYVAGGARFHGAQSTPGRVCTDFGGVKVVDVSNPGSPQSCAARSTSPTRRPSSAARSATRGGASP